jgi:hypothetical protein
MCRCTCRTSDLWCVKIYTVNERKCGDRTTVPNNEDRLAQSEEESVRRCQMICSIPFTRLKISGLTGRHQRFSTLLTHANKIPYIGTSIIYFELYFICQRNYFLFAKSQTCKRFLKMFMRHIYTAFTSVTYWYKNILCKMLLTRIQPVKIQYFF